MCVPIEEAHPYPKSPLEVTQQLALVMCVLASDPAAHELALVAFWNLSISFYDLYPPKFALPMKQAHVDVLPYFAVIWRYSLA